MTPSYDAFFVALSAIVAVLASFAALNLAGRVHSVQFNVGPTGVKWILAGGSVLGLAMWSMHFIGMRAMHLAVPIGYNASLMMLSAVVAIIMSLLALMVFNRPELGVGTVVPGGLLMGAAIAGMHYIAMASLRVEASLRYTTSIVVLSIVFGIVVSMAALWLASRFRSGVTTRGLLLKMGSALVLGAAISGTHYIGMAATHFYPGQMGAHSVRYIFASGEMDQVVVAGAVLIILLAVIGAVFDRNVQAGRAVLTQQLAEQTLELKKSEQQYRVLFDHNPNPMWVYSDSTRAFLAVNEAAMRRYGYSRAEFLSMSRQDLRVQPEPQAHASNGVFRANGGADPTWNGQHRKKNGTVIDVAVSSRAITFDGHEASIALILDVTDPKRAEEALRQSEQRLRLILDNALDAVITMRPSGAISDWNAQAEKMFGWSRAEALGQQMSSTIIPERYRDHHDRGLKKFLATGVGPVLNKRIEITALRRDGSEFPVELAISPAKVGEEWTFSAFIRDLTGKIEAERALHASERRLVQILEAVPLGILVADETGQIVFANAGGQKTLGSGVVASVGVGKLAEVYQAYLAGTDQLYPTERMPLVRALRGEVSAVDDMELHHGDHVVSLSVKGAPILDTDGKIVSAVVAFIDTSERKSLEAQVRQASKMEAVGQLAGGVAHDFNNLLTVIMSYGSMLLDRLAPDDCNREDVQEIAAAADRAAALTKQLLAFSRKQVMQPQVMDINAVIHDVENMLRRIIGEDIELQTSLDPGVGTINADPGQLQQVLMNLVVNARDAMPAGGRLQISTSNSRLSVESAQGAVRAVDGDYVVLTVSDTGTGMTTEVQRRLFDPFFTTKDQGRGTGLGLSTVYGIIKQSNGEIFVHSELGEGSSFNVYFPHFTATAEHPVPAAKAVEVPRGFETVLLVEDDANVRSLATRVLAGYGYNVLVASGGVEALAIALDPTILIDVVLTDVVMPGINGRELLEQIVSARPGLATLLMSGYTDDEVLRRGVMQGEAVFLQKPFTPEQLARKVRLALDLAVMPTTV
jgi:two-component system cell cycle sensor histidine kinase/response regulator CckA